MDIGIIYILGIGSLGAYGILIAGWASGNKYSLLGALRASAQMISYELALGLSIVGILICYSTFDFMEMVAHQQGPLHIKGFGLDMHVGFLPHWGIFLQPIAAILRVESSHELGFCFGKVKWKSVAFSKCRNKKENGADWL